MKLNNVKIILLFSVLVFLDQFSKYLIRLQGGFYICNKNISWGIKIPEFLFWLFWMVIIFLIIFLLYKKRFAHGNYYVILILAGSVSNIIDRLAFGCIFDFINLGFWPVFNLADVFITAGVILLLAKYWKA